MSIFTLQTPLIYQEADKITIKMMSRMSGFLWCLRSPSTHAGSERGTWIHGVLKGFPVGSSAASLQAVCINAHYSHVPGQEKLYLRDQRFVSWS